MADNDQFRILVGGTATNAGYAEIATADDGTEPIYVRQYTGVFSSLTRTATLLDGSGNTSFPGTVSATFSGNLTGTASFATFATNALSASIALNANTASFATSAASATSASYATFAATASSADNFIVRGNVGIGTTSPATKLDVSGSLSLSGYLFAQKSGNYNIVYNQAGGASIYLGGSGDPGNYYDNTSHNFRNIGGGTNYVTINSSGNVGIGTTSPS
jgi:hypothetical protein